MKLPVRFDPAALDDLDELYGWLADRAGPGRASRYAEGLRAYCAGLSDFPERGSRRDEIRPGLRVAVFQRRVSIAFVVKPDAVVVLRMLYGGRDLEGLLSE